MCKNDIKIKKNDTKNKTKKNDYSQNSFLFFQAELDNSYFQIRAELVFSQTFFFRLFLKQSCILKTTLTRQRRYSEEYVGESNGYCYDLDGGMKDN